MGAEQALRREVALANRIIERFGLSNAFGCVSARLPGTDTFLFPTCRSSGLADEKALLVLDVTFRRKYFQAFQDGGRGRNFRSFRYCWSLAAFASRSANPT